MNPLIPECSLTMLAANPGAGKTIFTAALGLAVAQGEPFLGLPTKQGGVLFIGQDAPAWDYGTVLRKLVNGAEPPAAFHLASHEGFKLLDPSWRARLAEYIKSKDIRLVVIDTLRAVHDKNENDSGEMQQVMNELRAISVSYAVSIIFLHHTSKANAIGMASEYRGSSVLLGSCDFFLHMTAEAGGPGTKILTLRMLKGRAANSAGDIQATLTSGGESIQLRRVGALVVHPALGLEGVVDAELAKGPVFMQELVALVPANGRRPKTIRGHIDKHLENLEKAGQVRSTLDHGRKRWERVSEVEKDAA